MNWNILVRSDASHAGKTATAVGHVVAAGRGKGLSALWRITRMALRHPVQVGIALVTTAAAAFLQLMIPRLLGYAVDQTQTVMGGGATGRAAEAALTSTALILLAVSIGRGLLTMMQNYFAESVGHHVGYELRLAVYEKIQRLSFSFHDSVHSGDLITVGMLDLEGVRMFFSTALVRTVLLTLSLIPL